MLLSSCPAPARLHRGAKQAFLFAHKMAAPVASPGRPTAVPECKTADSSSISSSPSPFLQIGPRFPCVPLDVCTLFHALVPGYRCVCMYSIETVCPAWLLLMHLRRLDARKSGCGSCAGGSRLCITTTHWHAAAAGPTTTAATTGAAAADNRVYDAL